MHRSTPLNTAFRAYSAGGARSVVDKVDDSQLMQEMGGDFMRNETRDKIESPQNYGFSSVVADGDKDGQGNLKMGAETFISFIGGSRSFPVAGNMDDRRHRLLNLAKDAAKGATAMFGLKEWGQQFLNTEKGLYMTGNTEKQMRFQLVDNQNGKKQQQPKEGALLARSFKSKSGVEFDIETFAAEGGGGGDQSSSTATGQKTLHKEESSTYVDLTKNAIATKRGNGFMNVKDNISQTYHSNPKHDTRCDQNHVHIGFEGSKIWVNDGGCYSSLPILLRNCDDQNAVGRSGPPATSGPPAYFAAAPMAIDNAARLTMAVAEPLALLPALARTIENAVPDIGPRTVAPLGLKFKSPLVLDDDGALTIDAAAIATLSKTVAELEAKVAVLTARVDTLAKANGHS